MGGKAECLTVMRMDNPTPVDEQTVDEIESRSKGEGNSTPAHNKHSNNKNNNNSSNNNSRSRHKQIQAAG